jgi:transcriptional regulator with XRE-family HTH domain
VNIEPLPDARSSQPKVGALIRSRRRRLHMTLQALGEAAGLSIGFLSQVERDQATPSLGALAGIARGLGVDIDYFIATPSIENGLTRGVERPRFSLPGSSVVYERLHAEFAGRGLSAFMMTVPPGHRSEMVRHEGDELLYVLEGELLQTIEEETVTLSAGDSLHFRGSSSHSWENRSERAAKVLWTGTMAILRPRTETQAPGSVVKSAEADTVKKSERSKSRGRTKP